MPICTCCNKTDESHKLVNCCVCKKPYRIDCVKISVSEARKIHLKTGFTWTCNNCIEFGEDLNSLKSIIASLQEEIKILKESVLQSATYSSSSLLDTEKVIQEISDRDRRKNNIVIFGRPEDKVNNNSEQINLDTVLVNEICMNVQVDVGDFKVSRLGKFDPTAANRKRPIKVSFSSDAAVARILRNIPKLKSNSKFSSLSIFRDRTPMQLQIHKEAKAELNSRIRNGETNLRIKYRNGIPSIVSLN